jgi:benzoyl-CoA reductase/2-hydroxyglutaryl-CoA dehydratase subunit BcrC/BadD/HgdB
MDIFESLENLNVSEECFNDIVGVVEDLIGVTQKNLKDAEKKYNKYTDRIKKVLKAKKENRTLDDTVRDKAWGMVYTGKQAHKFIKAQDLADKAEKLHRATHNYPDSYYHERKHKDK